MATVKAKTAARGYGSQHKAERERRLARYRPGDLCAHGGEPMWWWPLSTARQYIDLPHTADRTGYLPGLACRRHNRGEPNRRRGGVRTWQQARLWLCHAARRAAARSATASAPTGHAVTTRPTTPTRWPAA